MSEVKNEVKSSVLTKLDLLKAWFKWCLAVEVPVSFDRMQALAFGYSMNKILRKLYKDDPDGLQDAMRRHHSMFNTNCDWGSIIHGITISLEEQKANGEDVSPDVIQSLKLGLMGPLAGIGDVVSQSIVYPILAGVCIQLALAGNYAGPILFEIIYKAVMLTLGYNMYMLGYKQGKSAIISFLKTGVLNQILDLVSIVGLMVVGSMAVNNISYNLSLIGWEVQNEIGSVSFNLQTTVLDALLPGILPLGLVLGVRALLKKRVKPNTIILIMFVLAFVTVGLGALCGAYH